MARRSALLLSCFLLAAATAQEDEPNAALLWWQAFSLYEEGSDDLLQRAEEGEPAAVAELLAGASLSLEVMERAAARSRCDWGIERERGPHALVPHLSQARRLARLAVVDARHALGDGRDGPALARIGQLLRLARHVGEDPLLISLLVQYSIEQQAFTLLADNLDVFDREALEATLDLVVADDLAAVRRAFGGEERLLLDWLLAEIEAGRPIDGLGLELDAAEIVAGAGGLREAYAAACEALQLPLPAALDRLEVLEAELIDGDNPLIAAVLPSLSRISRRAAGMAVRRAMLAAAFARLHGTPGAVERVLDPCGDGPFECVPGEEGRVEWRSELLSDGAPFSWTTR